MILGFYIAKYFASGVAQQRCISIECGLQNGTLALFVGTQMFGENINTFIVPTAAYALIMMMTSVIFEVTVIDSYALPVPIVSDNGVTPPNLSPYSDGEIFTI